MIIIVAVIAGAAAADTYSVAQLIAGIDKSYAIRESDAAAAGMALKKDAVGGAGDLRLGYELMDAPNPDMLTHRFSLKQELPLWGKRARRRAAAGTEEVAARLMKTDRALELRQALLGNLIEYYYARRIERIRGEELELLRRFAESAKGKYSTGVTTFSALSRAEIEAAQTESMAASMKAMADIAENRVFDLIDLDSGDAAIGLFVPRTRADAIKTLDAPTLYRKALDHLPSLAAAANDIERAKRDKESAAAELLPDLMLEFSYSYKPASESPNSFSVGMEINLPALSLSAKNAEIAMAAKRTEERTARLAGAKNDLHRSIRKNLAEIADYGRRIDIYEQRIRGLRTADLDNLLSAYAVDKADFDMVLEALRMRFDAEISDSENRRSQALALLELEYMTGENLVFFEDRRTE